MFVFIQGRFNNEPTDLLAGNIAAISYLYSGPSNVNKFKTLTESVLDKDATNLMVSF